MAVKLLDQDQHNKAVFGSLSIHGRVLETPTRTIAIKNVATVTVVEGDHSGHPLMILMGVGLGIFSLFLIRDSLAVGLGLLFVAGLLVFFGLQPRQPDDRLIIATNNGTWSIFSTKNRETLQRVRRLLTDVINDEGGAATYNINFQQGTIERLEVGKAEGATFVTGDGNTVQSNSPGAKITDTENFFSANNSPGAVVGSGNAVSGNTVSSVVDYGEHTRTIEDWRNFYQGQPGAEELARRLGELERLMKEGTPGSAQKSRVRSLVTDLAVVLQSYPAMVQIVQQIGRLAG